MSNDQLVTDLEDIISLLRNSEESDWAPFTPPKLIDALGAEILAIQTDGAPRDVMGLIGLFAAAGPIQEIAMANEWADPFIPIADRVDIALGVWP